MGTHVSFVRSIDMDKFTVEQLARMAAGGNKRAKIYFDSKGIPRNSQGYSSRAAMAYKALLDGDKTQSGVSEKVEEPDRRKGGEEDWFDQKMKSVTPAKKLGARQIDNSEFDTLFTQTNPTSEGSYSQGSYPPFSYMDRNSEFFTPTQPTGLFGDSSTFRTNTRVSHREGGDYWPSIEESAQNNIHELKEGIKYIISKGNTFYDKAKHWFSNV